MRKLYLNIFGMCFFLMIFSYNLNAQVATIYLTDTMQTISGFGGAVYPEWGVNMTSDQIDKAFGNNPGQIGLNILRVPVPVDTFFSREVPPALRVKANGGIVFASPWSPPAYMKTNDSIPGGRLDTLFYDNFAIYLDSFANVMASRGASLEAISIQNEPDWNATYASCNWYAKEMINFLKKSGSKITSTKIIAPESLNFKHSFSDSILNDSVAASYVDIIGGHLYGVNPSDYPLARAKGKEVWMTEHYTDSANWTSGLQTAKEIHNCMADNFNAYIYWYLKRDNGFMYDNGDISKKGYVISQYAKFVRPGYIRVNATYSGAPVALTAYKNDTNVVIIILNGTANSIDMDITLQDDTVYSFTKFTTSETKNIKNDGTVITSDNSFTANLDAYSLTTFTNFPDNGGKYGNKIPVTNAGPDAEYTDNDTSGTEVVTLDGSLSNDTDGTIAIYTWSEAGNQIASGVNPTVNMATGVHRIALTVTDNDGALATDSVIITVNLPSGVNEVNIWLEAECGIVGSNWNILSDAAASNGKYITVKAGTQLLDTASVLSINQAVFNFDVTETGNYKVWGRCKVPTANDDSYWVQMDGGIWARWNNIHGGSSFQWDTVFDQLGANTAMIYNLTPGSHTLKFCYREDGALLDKIYITNTGNIPSGLGNTAHNCPETEIARIENNKIDFLIFPNPIRNNSIVEFTLEKTEYVNLAVIDITGRTIATLVNGIRQAGLNKVTFNSSNLENGIYLCRFGTGENYQTKQIMIIR